MIFIIQILYGGACVMMGWWDARDRNRGNYTGMHHTINFATHITAAVLVSIFIKWYAGFIILCLARIIFTTSLNYFSVPRLPIDYVTAEKRPRAITDRIEKSIFGMDGIFPLVIYLVALIVLNIFYAVQN